MAPASAAVVGACAVFVAARGLALQPPRVVVAGATGRTGRLVVEELLARPGNVHVTALVRDGGKASEVLDAQSPRLRVVPGVDLTDAAALREACADACAVVWCASGPPGGAPPSEPQNSNPLLAALLRPFGGLAPSSPSGAGAQGGDDEPFDARALRAIGEASAASDTRVVCLSSAATTRPAWSDEAKKRYVGAADIPIVRLNPGGILDAKRRAEAALRSSHADVRYVVVRPTGLNDDWPRGRPVVSQGDLAVGRTCRKDVAALLADLALDTHGAGTAAEGKTFEVLTLAGYAAPASLKPQLDRLAPDEPDTDGRPSAQPLDAATLDATYALLQQLVPGETLQPERLAMGQTYEQLDANETGRLGERGQERVPASLS